MFAAPSLPPNQLLESDHPGSRAIRRLGQFGRALAGGIVAAFTFGWRSRLRLPGARPGIGRQRARTLTGNRKAGPNDERNDLISIT
jgi:hypothetical protein